MGVFNYSTVLYYEVRGVLRLCVRKRDNFTEARPLPGSTDGWRRTDLAEWDE